MEIIRKILDFICTVIMLIILAIAGMYLLGIKPFLMVTDSMKPTFASGSICFVDTHYSYEKIKKNDIIMYESADQKVIHRVVDITEDGYKTKGDANSKEDVADITSDIFLGKYIFSIPKVGSITSKIDTPVKKGIFLTCLIVLFIINYLMRYVKEKKNT